ncbi:methyltransferase, FkbM family [Clostridium cavendishii DSM 21758]|uniref:Methyltransferase, FkbM family n=1 Tax=Clostridium cavendishii DSM 21758 TaxID=1121302 RepID=A0A1M6IY28_9CLOT|nr:FkbM family methyltransferase [Clostridium cavendishii]SHJ39312.1 methyltransferase, FkbM family [Clostridium cavendishii DSM 21758]
MCNDKYLDQLKKAIEYATNSGSFNKKNIVYNAENVCVFGLGTYFKEAFLQQNVMERFHVNMLCDNNYKKAEEILKDNNYKGLKFITIEELKSLDNVVVILMLGDPREVEKQLKDLGINNCITYNDLSLDTIMDLPCDKKWFKNNSGKLIDAYNCLSDEESRKVFVNVICNHISPLYSNYSYEELYSSGEYFNTGLFNLSKNECFVDCGAYNGDTIDTFLKETNNMFEKIFAFELDSDNYRMLTEAVACYDSDITKKVKCYNLGVWNQECEITYGKGTANDRSDGISIYKSNNKNIAKVIKLDDILLGNKITLIKMDIEGAEQNALKGAENIIRKQKPKMAICLYHRLDDFWEIPLYLKKLVPQYKVNIRHHYYYNCWGTVCYVHL